MLLFTFKYYLKANINENVVQPLLVNLTYSRLF